MERLVFGSAGLVGVLRLPPGEGPWPGIVFTGPFTGVKEQVVGLYAERLTAEGFATLAFDHRGFGESGGRRGHEDTQGKLEDLRDAVSVLADQPGVDEISVVGICLGGGYAVRAAASDPRIKAVAGIAGAYNSPAHVVESMGAANYRAALGGFLDRYDEFLPAVAPDGGEAAMGGDEPYAYYGTSRSASPHWDGQVTRGSLHSLMTFDALSAADLLGDTPLLVVHGRTDAYCSPDLARALHARSPGPKEIHWLDTREHIDLYDVEPHVTTAIDTTAAFMHRVLGSADPRKALEEPS